MIGMNDASDHGTVALESKKESLNSSKHGLPSPSINLEEAITESPGTSFQLIATSQKNYVHSKAITYRIHIAVHHLSLSPTAFTPSRSV
jgi:hypothetical protein